MNWKVTVAVWVGNCFKFFNTTHLLSWKKISFYRWRLYVAENLQRKMVNKSQNPHKHVQEKACVPNLSVQLLVFQRTKGQIKSEWIGVWNHQFSKIWTNKFEGSILMYIGQKSFKFFVSYFEKLMISYIHSDLIWPLIKTILGKRRWSH